MRFRSSFRGVPALTLLLGAGLLTGALAGVIYFRFSGGDTATVGQSGGGGGQPPEEPLAISQALPRFPASTQDGAPISTGRGVQTFYLVKDTPFAVDAFFVAELAKAGWRPEGPATSETSGTLLDGTVATNLIHTFVKDGFRVTLKVGESDKDPSRGQARLLVVVEPL